MGFVPLPNLQIRRSCLGSITLTDAEGTLDSYADDRYKIGSGNTRFETFDLDISEELRGQAVNLKFSTNSTVLLDNIFFKSQHLAFGNPTDARFDNSAPDSNTFSDNLLLERPQYTVSYNDNTLTPNWVGWQLDKSWITTDIERQSQFAGDPQLPNGFDRAVHRSYSGSGYDRGHMIPSRDRSRYLKDNTATFLTTNVQPQSIDNNRFMALLD